MEIKDNMEHLSLSQSKSNMKQFNKQLQAIPREMIEWLGLRGHAGRLQTVRRGFFTRACCRVLGNCARVKNDTPAKSEQWASPEVLKWFALLKSISAGQDANSRAGSRRGAPESFLYFGFLYFGVHVRVCARVRVCLVGSISTWFTCSLGKECLKDLKICKNSKLVALPFYI